MEAGEFEKAKKINLESLPLLDEKSKHLSMVDLALIYLETGKEDSADYYADQAYQLHDQIDIKSAINLYELLYQIEKEKKNYDRALSYHEQLMDTTVIVLENQANVSILNVQKKFETKLLKSQIKVKDRTIFAGVVSFILILVLIAIVVYFVFQKQKRKIEKVNREYDTLKSMAASYNKNEQNYRNIIIEHFEILKKVSVIDHSINDYDRENDKLLRLFYNITYGKEGFDWDKLFNTINIMKDGFLLKAKEIFDQYPDLKESDFKIWCLSYSDFTQDEISLILQISVRTIQTRVSNTRIAFGIEKKADINKFIESKIKENNPGIAQNQNLDQKPKKSAKMNSANSLA